MASTLKLLQEWYADQCNDDWEHSYGVKIDTIDNPGWILEVDLQETKWEELSVPLVRKFVNDQDWMQFEVIGGRYIACGDAFKLNNLIEQFICLVWPQRLMQVDYGEQGGKD